VLRSFRLIPRAFFCLFLPFLTSVSVGSWGGFFSSNRWDVLSLSSFSVFEKSHQQVFFPGRMSGACVPFGATSNFFSLGRSPPLPHFLSPSTPPVRETFRYHTPGVFRRLERPLFLFGWSGPMCPPFSVIFGAACPRRPRLYLFSFLLVLLTNQIRVLFPPPSAFLKSVGGLGCPPAFLHAMVR